MAQVDRPLLCMVQCFAKLLKLVVFQPTND